MSNIPKKKKKKAIFAEIWSRRSIVWHYCGGARVMRFNFTHSPSTTRTHVLACSHTCTDVRMAYSGRHACQQRWRALSWLLLNQPFPPPNEARLGEGEGKSWLSEHQTASIEQSQQAGGDWNRVEKGKKMSQKGACLTWTPPKVGFSGNAVCRCLASTG